MTFDPTYTCLCLLPMTCYNPYPSPQLLSPWVWLALRSLWVKFPSVVRSIEKCMCDTQMQLKCSVCFICHNDDLDDDLIDVCILERCYSFYLLPTHLGAGTAFKQFIPHDPMCQFSCRFTSNCNGSTPAVEMLPIIRMHVQVNFEWNELWVGLRSNPPSNQCLRSWA